MKKIITLMMGLFVAFQGFSQTYYNWNFNSGFPADFYNWNLDGQTPATSLTTNYPAFASTNGWIIFPTTGATRAAYAASTFNNTSVAADRWLVTPRMAVPTAVTNVVLSWDAFSNSTTRLETYEVRVSTTDSSTAAFMGAGALLTTITDEPGATHVLPMAAYAGMNVRIAFRCISLNKFVLGVSGIRLLNLPSYDMAIQDVQMYEHNYIGTASTPTGTLKNQGFNTITSFNLNYSVNGGAPVTETVSGVNITPLSYYTYTSSNAFNPTTANLYKMKVWCDNINGSNADGVPSNDTGKVNLFFYPHKTGLNKSVMIEEFTGAWCGYCPAGALFIRDIVAADPYVIPVAIHDQNGQGVTADRMQIPEGHTINGIYNVVGFPSAMMDRLYTFDNQAEALGFNLYNTVPGVSIQQTVAEMRHGMATPVNVSFSELSYDNSSGALSVNVNATFLNSLAEGDYRLNLYLVEDSIITTGAGYDQHNYYSTAGSNVDAGNSPMNALPSVITNDGQANDWAQNHVLRAMMGGAWGTQSVIPSAPTADSTYSYTYTTTLDPTWRDKFVSIIGVVQEYNTNVNLRTILNSVERPLLGYPAGIKETSQLTKLSIYPNPATTMATLDMDLKQNAMVNVAVVNTLGQTVIAPQDNLLNAGGHTIKVPVSNLASGLYFVKVTVNGEVNTLPLSISAK